MSVIHVGIDIGKRKHEATILDAEGNQLGHYWLALTRH